MLQPLVPFALYSTVAADSVPDTLNVPTLVMLSTALAPLSVVSATVGAATVVSMTTAWVSRTPLLTLVLLVLMTTVWEPSARAVAYVYVQAALNLLPDAEIVPMSVPSIHRYRFAAPNPAE